MSPSREAPVVSTRNPRDIERLRTLTRLLDSAIQIPGTRYRIGLDAIVGVVPGIGDAVGALFSAFIVFQAARMGVSTPTLVRMMGNLALDTIVGEIPLLGDLFDAGWKANTRNLALLEGNLEQPARTRRSSRRALWLIGGALLLLLVGVIAVAIIVANLVIEQLR
ncbi:MAG TPA: DUF4112 domain-containing protein [Gemmatimonadales bacterium]|nr:DUF4112 domain-containing protein [Gemmatimonadales bacterium]